MLTSSLGRTLGKLRVSELFFQVPKNHADPSAGTLTLFARSAVKHERPIVRAADAAEAAKESQRPLLVFLQGGPGYGNDEPQNHPGATQILDRGYELLLLDYRGTGLSTPVTADALARLEGGAPAQAEHLRLFRADSIVRDCEAVRACLTADYPAHKKKWSLFCQSYGGFVAMTYLSKFPAGLREVFLTGGLAPVTATSPDRVYQSTYRHVVARNEAYYDKFPEDVARVHRLADHILAAAREAPDETDEKDEDGRSLKRRGGAIALPGGGTLTVGRLMGLGLHFGAHGGLDSVHSQILRMTADLDQFGFLTRPALASFERMISFDTEPIYAVLHESIYCTRPGVASNWAAWRVGCEMVACGGAPGSRNFGWLPWQAEGGGRAVTRTTVSIGNQPRTDRAAQPTSRPTCASDKKPPTTAAEMTGGPDQPLFFSGEMVYPFHLNTYPELRRMREAAELVARFGGWDEPLYDEAQLARNDVPVYAASFVNDMYVDFGLARETAALVCGVRVYETNGLYHSALRAATAEVLGKLFALRDDTID